MYIKYFRNINTGDKFESDYKGNLPKCPYCNLNNLHTNRFDDFKTINTNDDKLDVSKLSVKMCYCSKCNALFVRDDY